MQVSIDGLVINSDALKWAVLKVPAGRLFRLDTAFLSAPIAVAAADANYNTLYLRNDSQTAAEILLFANGPAATGLAVSLAGTEFTAGANKATYQFIGSDSAETVLYLTSTKTGNGLALPDCQLHVRGVWLK
jgi:hypothetical protein